MEVPSEGVQGVTNVARCPACAVQAASAVALNQQSRRVVAAAGNGSCLSLVWGGMRRDCELCRLPKPAICIVWNTLKKLTWAAAADWQLTKWSSARFDSPSLQSLQDIR